MQDKMFGELHQRLPLKDLKATGEVLPGTTITGVKPQDLWTTQDWIEESKVQAALNRKPDMKDYYPTRGYISNNDGKIKLVLGDGNTKAIVAWVRGQRVEFTVEGGLPQETVCIPLSRLRSKYHDLFREFEYS